MIKILVNAAILPKLQQALTVLADDFGNQFSVQTNLVAAGADHAADVARETAVFQANEDRFVAQLQGMGMSDEEINRMKVQ